MAVTSPRSDPCSACWVSCPPKRRFHSVPHHHRFSCRGWSFGSLREQEMMRKRRLSLSFWRVWDPCSVAMHTDTISRLALGGRGGGGGDGIAWGTYAKTFETFHHERILGVELN